MKMDGWGYALLGLASMAAGVVNALAGGGTLITFPMLTMLGIPALTANVTNTVALCPGYFGATLAQWNDLRGQKSRLWFCLPASVFGGAIGGLLVLNTDERMFLVLVPFLILLASGLLAVNEPVRAWLVRRTQQAGSRSMSEQWAVVPIGLAAIYGGYFGAGLSVIVLAVLGLLINDSLTRLNALKQGVALSVNVAAAIVFLFSDHVAWPAAIVMAIGALIGGALGGRLAGRIRPSVLRGIVVAIGVSVATYYFIRG
jgi:uncharacterized protein